MVFQIFSVVVPLILLLVLPWLLRSRLGAESGREKKARPILVAAVVLFGVSYYLPSPLIDGMETHFWTHFWGGGVFCSLLWLYISLSLKLRQSFAARGVSVFVLTASLGVINELVEFVLVKLTIASITLADTSWDLVANTVGCIFGWLCIEVARYLYDSRH